MWQFLFCASAALILSGCTHYSNSFIVGTTTGLTGQQIEPPQFLKLDLAGYAIWNATQFQCGWYAKDAVDKLFSEVVVEAHAQNTGTPEPKTPSPPTVSFPTQIPDTKSPPKIPDTKSPTEIANTKRSPEIPDKGFLIYGPQGQTVNPGDRRFVMIAASNPKAIVDQIDAFTSNQDTSSALMTLLQTEALQARLRADRASKQDELARDGLLSEIDRVVNQATDSWTSDRLLNAIDGLIRAIPTTR